MPCQYEPLESCNEDEPQDIKNMVSFAIVMLGNWRRALCAACLLWPICSPPLLLYEIISTIGYVVGLTMAAVMLNA